MRRRATIAFRGIVLPVMVLVLTVASRRSIHHHAWDWQWCLWDGFQVLMAVLLGWGLHVYWGDRRRP